MLAVRKMRLDTLKKADLPDHLTENLKDSAALMGDVLTYTRELMSSLPPPALE